MGADFGHLLLLHWCLHADWRFGVGLDNEFPGLLLSLDGTWSCIAHCEYENVDPKKGSL